MNCSAAPTPRFAFYLVEPVPLADALALGVQAEDWGFDLVAVCENLFWWNPIYAPVWDNFTVLTAIAARTQSIGLMTNVIDPVKRHPAVIAHTVATLDQMTSGRVTLGIGAGEIGNYGPLLDVIGPPPHQLYGRTKEFIEVVHGVWRSSLAEPFVFQGKHFQLHNAHLSLKPFTQPHPPIYLAGMSPKTKHLTGAVADGWTPVTYTPETYANAWADVQQGARNVGRNPAALDRALTICTVVLNDEMQAKSAGSLAGRKRMSARPALLRELGYPELAGSGVDVTQKEDPCAGHDIVQRIPASLGEKATICGTPHQAIQQIEEFIDAGVQMFVLWMPYDTPQFLQETIDHYRQTILPYFSARR